MNEELNNDNNSRELNPIEWLKAELEQAIHMGQKEGILTVKSANDWIEDASKRPDPKSYFYGLITENENTVLFASANVGKSILAVQIAEDIAKTATVYYVDLELSDKQFQLRYSDSETGDKHIFPPQFRRAEIAPELIGGVDLEQEIIDSVETAAMNGAKFIIIDNITFICSDAENSKVASDFMMKLIRLKKEYGLTTIIIAHTPKRRGDKPITHNDLAGSSRLINFFDAAIALALSAIDSNLRYLKQVKVRTGKYLYDSDNVIVLDLVKTSGYLHFEIQGYAKEYEHLKQGKPSEEREEIQECLRLKKQGYSFREIANNLMMSTSKVQRRLQKANELNITLDEEDDYDNYVSIVSDGSDSVPPEKPIIVISQALTINEEDS
jgi:KaiC/GvpD/RAD55 family RecA-like ATPase